MTLPDNTPWDSQKEAELIEVIVKAVPEICTKVCDCCGGDWDYCFGADSECSNFNDGSTVECRPITLEDVLRVFVGELADRLELAIPLSGVTLRIRHADEYCDWSLGLPLSDQPSPTKQFLYSLLCSK